MFRTVSSFLRPLRELRDGGHVCTAPRKLPQIYMYSFDSAAGIGLVVSITVLGVLKNSGTDREW